jgi:hypothetical protein
VYSVLQLSNKPNKLEPALLGKPTLVPIVLIGNQVVFTIKHTSSPSNLDKIGSLSNGGHGFENVKHFLRLCKNHKSPRKEFRKMIGRRNMRMENLIHDLKLVKNILKYEEKLQIPTKSIWTILRNH